MSIYSKLIFYSGRRTTGECFTLLISLCRNTSDMVLGTMGTFISLLIFYLYFCLIKHLCILALLWWKVVDSKAFSWFFVHMQNPEVLHHLPIEDKLHVSFCGHLLDYVLTTLHFVRKLLQRNLVNLLSKTVLVSTLIGIFSK